MPKPFLHYYTLSIIKFITNKNMEIPSAKTILSAAASATAAAVVIRSVAKEFVPHEFRHFLRHKVFFIFSSLSPWITIIIDESDGLRENRLFSAAEIYLGAKISPSTQRFRAAIPAKETEIVLSMDKNQEVIDVFDGVQFRWKKINKQIEPSSIMYDEERSRRSVNKTEISHFKLSFHKKHREMAVNLYLPHIVSESQRFKEAKKTLKIHTLKYNQRYRGSGKPWVSVNLDHPATFETLAMDLEMKNMIMEDLEMFVKRKEFYRRVGKAWKRGYLLYGPPGTGKSSLIAAMANYLNFDIYDLELTDVSNNSDLRKLIIGTANRSILVVEDIDCSIDLENRKAQSKVDSSIGGHQVTLSGLLNFIDGLWSSCGDERIIIFTTNHKERLDPALLRPGRMDVHIHMSYCTPCGFRMLASNYLKINEHSLFTEVEQLLPTAKVTPAEIGEQLMKTEVPETALRGLVELLKVKKDENHQKNIISEKESENSEVVESEVKGAKKASS